MESQDLLNQYKLIIQNLAVGIIVKKIDGTVTFISPYMEVLTGYSISNIKTYSSDFLESIIVKDDQEKYSRALKIATCGESYSVTLRARHKSNINMWYELRVEPIFSEAQQVSAILIIIVDVTRIMRYQKQTEEVNKNMQDFTYMLSHDLKAPLYTIKGMVSVLKEELVDIQKPQISQILEHLTKAIFSLENLISSILQYSKANADEVKIEKINLDSLIKDVLNDLSSQIQNAAAKITVNSKLDVEIYSDHIKLYQIFSNIISNSIKFRDKTRNLLIDINISYGSTQNECTIVITDNGIGIAQDKLELIFKPFYKAHGTNIEGSGIGLACVSRLIDKLNGSVSAQSIEGKGSIFTVFLKNGL